MKMDKNNEYAMPEKKKKPAVKKAIAKKKPVKKSK